MSAVAEACSLCLRWLCICKWWYFVQTSEASWWFCVYNIQFLNLWEFSFTSLYNTSQDLEMSLYNMFGTIGLCFPPKNNINLTRTGFDRISHENISLNVVTWSFFCAWSMLLSGDGYDRSQGGCAQKLQGSTVNVSCAVLQNILALFILHKFHLWKRLFPIGVRSWVLLSS